MGVWSDLLLSATVLDGLARADLQNDDTYTVSQIQVDTNLVTAAKREVVREVSSRAWGLVNDQGGETAFFDEVAGTSALDDAIQDMLAYKYLVLWATQRFIMQGDRLEALRELWQESFISAVRRFILMTPDSILGDDEDDPTIKTPRSTIVTSAVTYT